MILAANQGVYECANIPPEQSLRRIKQYGFRYIDLAAKNLSDPTEMGKSRRSEIVRIFRGEQFICSQLLMINARDIASPDRRRQTRATDYMKACAEFQLELGGNHVLVCWGAGIHESGTTRGRMWINSVNSVRNFAEWASDRNLLVSIEMDPHVYYVVNSLERMARLIEEVGMPNVFANIDIGHLCITREGPDALERVSRRVLHVHLSETNSFEHTNGILGSGVVDFQSYFSKLQEIGVDDNCSRNNTACVAAIEMGQQGCVDDPDRWMRESLSYLEKALPQVKIRE